MYSNINGNTITEDEFFYGSKACAGCGGSLVVRTVLKVLGEKTYLALPAGCMSAVSFNYPQLCFANNAIISTFAGTGSILSGMLAGAKKRGFSDYHIVGIAGDGGTADIGIQALSGAIDRNDRVIYICYDNEAYMNTGVQKSSLTPYGAKTTTTPAGSYLPGNIGKKKNMFELVAAHQIAYAATASIGYLSDFAEKVRKASTIEGTSYIHVLAPCPTGWGINSSDTIKAARQVVENGLWYLAEYENQEFHLNYKPHQLVDVGEYLLSQKRFAHLTEQERNRIQEERDQKWETILQHWKLKKRG